MNKEYEKYKLQWMIDHGYTLQDLFSEMANIMEEELTISVNPHVLLDEAFEIFEEEIGFNGSLWVCKDEWETDDRPALLEDEIEMKR